MNNPLAHVTSFLQFPVTIRRLYLYLSLNNHASLEMPIKRVRELGLIRRELKINPSLLKERITLTAA
jgi:hypothetical protein